MESCPENEFISHAVFLELLSAAVDGSMTDAAFRRFVRQCLPMAIGYAGGTPQKAPIENVPKTRFGRGDDFRDRRAEQFIDK